MVVNKNFQIRLAPPAAQILQNLSKKLGVPKSIVVAMALHRMEKEEAGNK